MAVMVESSSLPLNLSEQKLNNDTLLWILNEQKALNNIPMILYLGILSIFGFIGNLHVLLVYTVVLKPNENYRIFVLFLAGFDIVACSLVMPFDIFVFRFPYTFDYIYPCKIFNFFKAAMILGSAFMLLVIAIERFQKICNPFGWQMTTKTATLACIFALLSAAVLAWPNSVFKGHATMDLKNGTIKGVECEIDDFYQGRRKKYPVIYYGCLFVIDVGFTVSLVVLYILIGRTLHKHAQLRRVKFNKNTNPENSSTHFTAFSSSSGQTKDATETTELSTDDRHSNHANNGKTPGTKNAQKIPKRKRVKSWDRMTKILFTITILFTLTLLPNLILVPVTILSKTFKSSLGPVGWNVYSIFRKFFYLNHMVNPIIYGFFDTTFRNICYGFYTKLFSWFRRC